MGSPLSGGLLMKGAIIAGLVAIALVYSGAAYSAYSYHRCGIDLEDYRNVALTGDLPSIEALAFYWTFCRRNDYEALFWLRFAHELGSIHATYSLATKLSNMDADTHKARIVHLYEIVASSGDACSSGMALANLAQINQKDGNIDQAFAYLRRGVDLGALECAQLFVRFVWQHRLEAEYGLAFAVAESAKRHMAPNSVGAASMESHIEHFRTSGLSDAAVENFKERVNIENLCEF
jgi:hypothetical protein